MPNKQIDPNLEKYLFKASGVSRKDIVKNWSIADLTDNHPVAGDAQNIEFIINFLLGDFNDSSGMPVNALLSGHLCMDVCRMIAANSVTRAISNPRKYLFAVANVIHVDNADLDSGDFRNHLGPLILTGCNFDKHTKSINKIAEVANSCRRQGRGFLVINQSDWSPKFMKEELSLNFDYDVKCGLVAPIKVEKMKYMKNIKMSDLSR